MNPIRYLLDTNIIIGLLKGNTAAIDLMRQTGCGLSDMAVSQITRMELLGFPHITKQEIEMIQRVLSAVSILQIDEAIENKTIALRRTRKIKLPDAIIAATAITHSLQLLTLDQMLNEVYSQG